LAHAQSCVFKIAEKKNLDLELRSQLCMGVYDLYNSALNLANDSLKNRVSDVLRSILNFRRMYFSAKSFLKMKDVIEVITLRTGEKYGLQITYLKMASASLNTASKEFSKVSGPEVDDAKALKDNLVNLLVEMEKKNNTLYHDFIPDFSKIPKIEKIVKVSPISIMEDLNKETSDRNIFQDLIPKETRKLINDYKLKMEEYISSSLEKEENDIKIAEYLESQSLPYSLDSAIGSEISDSLWNSISEVQQKGGTLYLTNQIANIKSRSDEIKKRLDDLEVVLFSEKSEDDRLRLLYGNKWTRNSSENLNKDYLITLKDYQSKIKYLFFYII
jgi:hypothetical protein